MFPGLLDVTHHEPVARDDPVKPREMRFVGMTVVAGGLYNLFRGRGSLPIGQDGGIGQIRPDELETNKADQANRRSNTEFESGFRNSAP
jgi:hypothetical protein